MLIVGTWSVVLVATGSVLMFDVRNVVVVAGGKVILLASRSVMVVAAAGSVVLVPAGTTEWRRWDPRAHLVN